MDFNEAQKIFDEAVRRHMKSEGIENYAEGYKSFIETEKGALMWKAYVKVRDRKVESD